MFSFFGSSLNILILFLYSPFYPRLYICDAADRRTYNNIVAFLMVTVWIVPSYSVTRRIVVCPDDYCAGAMITGIKHLCSIIRFMCSLSSSCSFINSHLYCAGCFFIQYNLLLSLNFSISPTVFVLCLIVE